LIKKGEVNINDKLLEFSYGQFTCDIDVFFYDDDVLIRFYDASKEQSEEKITDLVIVDPGFGFLCLKLKGESALLSGYLVKDVFVSEEMVSAAIDFIEGLSPKYKNIYIPYHIALVKQVGYVEYNGEY